MGGSRRVWGRVALFWLACVGVGLVAFTIVRALFPPDDVTVASAFTWALLTCCGVALFRRRIDIPYDAPDAPKMRVVEQVAIARPVEEVFAFLADVRNEPRWCPQVIEVAVTPPRPLGAGSTYRETVRVGGRKMTIEFVVTAYEPPFHMATRGRVGRRPGTAAFTLAADGAGTRLTTVSEMPISALTVPFRSLFVSAASARREAC